MIIFLMFFILSSTIDLHSSLSASPHRHPNHTVVEVGTDSFEQVVVARNIALSTQAINRLHDDVDILNTRVASVDKDLKDLRSKGFQELDRSIRALSKEFGEERTESFRRCCWTAVISSALLTGVMVLQAVTIGTVYHGFANMQNVTVSL